MHNNMDTTFKVNVFQALQYDIWDNLVGYEFSISETKYLLDIIYTNENNNYWLNRILMILPFTGDIVKIIKSKQPRELYNILEIYELPTHKLVEIFRKLDPSLIEDLFLIYSAFSPSRCKKLVSSMNQSMAFDQGVQIIQKSLTWKTINIDEYKKLLVQNLIEDRVDIQSSANMLFRFLDLLPEYNQEICIFIKEIFNKHIKPLDIISSQQDFTIILKFIHIFSEKLQPHIAITEEKNIISKLLINTLMQISDKNSCETVISQLPDYFLDHLHNLLTKQSKLRDSTLRNQATRLLNIINKKD